MKTKHLILIVLANCILAINAQEPTNYLKDENIKGKVKSFTETYTGVKYPNEQWKYEYLFNAKGQLTKKTYFSKGALNSVTEYIYDAKGFLISEKLLDKDGNVSIKMNYVNDLKGRKIKETTYYDGSAKPSYVKTIIRNPAGKIITESSIRLPENKIYYPKNSFKYDAKGNAIEEYTAFGDGVYSKTTHQYTYDVKGRIEKDYSVNIATSMIDFEDEKKAENRIYTYDDKDRIIAVTYENGDVLEQYAYDEKGNKTKENQDEYIYEYDNSGNWTKRTKITNGQTYCAEERVYVYSE